MGMALTLFIVMVLVIGLSAAAFCDADVEVQAGFELWVADSLTKIAPRGPIPDQPIAPVQVDAVRNEYESAQVVATASKDIAKLTVEVSPLKGPGKTVPTVTWNFLGSVPVTKGTFDTPPEHLIVKPPADVPDPLLEVRSISVPRGTSQPIWLTIYVARTTTPGVYSGTVKVSSESGSLEVPINVKVHSATLPDTRTLNVTNWFWPELMAEQHKLEPWSEPFWKMLEAYARFMADYRQNAILTPLYNLIKVRADTSGKLSFDFSSFDRWIRLFQNAGVTGLIEGTHLASREEWEAKELDVRIPPVTQPDGSVKPWSVFKVSDEQTRAFLSQFLPALQKHLEDKGLIKRYVQHLADEPISASADSYKKLASLVRGYAPKFRILDACMCTEIAGSIDIWVPLTNHFDSDMKFFQERQKAGEEVWFYTCLLPKGKYMNRFIDYPLLDTRLLHWANFKYGTTGYLHWGFNYWKGDPFKDFEHDWGTSKYLPPGDSHIVYPGKRGPLSSVRMEAMRDGIEDYELLSLLAKKNPTEAKAIADSVIKTMTDYTLDPVVFRSARMKLIQALSK